ncbi:aquaporin-11 isoform X2 [Ambystoma mexicanum]|uniref:aquaporin-11 isoform X2 n=1 Tax=Ambystoma mexicanum TaxID=8296 RepID=UPI0037E88566
MEGALPSLLLLCGTVLACVVARRGLRAGSPALELVCAFQLCACTHELWLLGVVGRVPPALSLSLTYTLTVVYGWTCTGALLNPTGALQQLLSGVASGKDTVWTLGAQLLAGTAARLWALVLRALPISALHGRAGAGCSSSLRTGLWHGAGVELACAFSVHCAVRLLPTARAPLRPHLLALVITVLVYTAGQLTGAMFNPALAFSLNFFCQGSSFTDNVVVYWVGPIAGMILSVGLFDHLIPAIKRLRRGPVEPEKTE